jgi:hypothetical protein
MDFDLGIKVVATWKFAPHKRLVTHQLKSVDPTHAILGANQQLKSSI